MIERADAPEGLSNGIPASNVNPELRQEEKEIDLSGLFAPPRPARCS